MITNGTKLVLAKNNTILNNAIAENSKNVYIIPDSHEPLRSTAPPKKSVL